MKKDIETKKIKLRDRRLREMPDFIADFIFSVQESKAISTQIEYIKDITLFFEFIIDLPEFSHIKNISELTIQDLKKLDEKDVRHFISHLTEYKKTFTRKDNSIYTQTFRNNQEGKARKLATLHVLYKWLTRNYDIIDITRHVEIKVNKKKQIKDKLDKNEIDKLVKTIIDDANIESKQVLKFHLRNKLRDLTITLLLAFTGIRIGELVQLDLDDISTKDLVMVVIRKSGDQELVYMPKEIISTLNAYIEKRKMLKDIPKEYENALFVTWQKKRIHPKTINAMLRKYKQRAKIDIKVTPHTFRRTFGTALLDQLGDIQLVADILGHSSPETTRKHYAQTSEKRKKQVVTKFNYANADKEDQENIDKSLKNLSEITGKSIEELKKEIGV